MFRLLWGRRRFLISTMCCALVLAGIYVFGLATPTYQSSASVVLEARKNTVVNLGTVVEDLGQDEEIVNSEVEVMRSRQLLLRVIDQLHLTQYPEFNPELSPENLITLTLAQIQQRLSRDIPDEVIQNHTRARALDILTRKLRVEAVPNSLVFRVSVRSRDPRLSAMIANTICRLYVNDQLQAKKDASKEAEDWLYARVLELQQELLEDEMQLKKSTGDRDLNAIRQLEREVDASADIYGHFLNRYKETAARTGLYRPDSRVLSAAIEPLKKDSPKTVRIMAFSLVMSLMLGVIWVLVSEMRSTRVRTSRALANVTGLPVLGLMPALKYRRAYDWHRYLKAPQFAAYLSAMRRLRQTAVPPQNNPQVIAVLGAQHCPTQPIFAGALALSLADLGNRVLLIEADPKAGVFVEYGADKGLFSVLAQNADPLSAVQSPSDLRFRILAPGKSDAVSADLLAMQKWPRLLTHLKTLFDVIIVNTPPILHHPDAALIAQVTDRALMLVRWNQTDSGQVEAAINALGPVAERLIGTVMTDVTQTRLERCGLGKSAEARYVELGKHYSV